MGVNVRTYIGMTAQQKNHLKDIGGNIIGMDYQYAGSASYPRFDRELCAIAEVFGAIKTEHLKERMETEDARPFGYWFGFLSSDDSKNPKFVFPKETNQTLIEWFNNIYGKFSETETKIIWNEIRKHPKIKYISNQIWDELKLLVDHNEYWEIL